VEARDPFRVLIAGGGVAGLEGALALRALAGDLVSLELLSATDRFIYKPMLVAEPFGVGADTSVDLGPLLDDADARHRRDSLAAVEGDERVAVTGQGERIGYDALLVAFGARPVEAIPGALTFSGTTERARFGELLLAMGRLGTRRLAFVVPPQATWSIAAYELALLTASERDARRIRRVEITVLTHEASPMALFGPAAERLVAAKLAEASVVLRTASIAESFDGRELRLAGGETVEADQVIALPGLEVPAVPGLPQREHGFLPTDDRMKIEGLDHVWAAGDATAFAVKQGGLAAQQAVLAARAIAASAGARVDVPPFRPVLRAAMITGDTPDFMQAPAGEPTAGIASTGHAPWATRAKLAAAHLGPRLTGGSVGERVPSHAVRTLLLAADEDARSGNYEAALGWLAVVEQLNLVIPAEYVVRRDEWRRRLDPELDPDEAARRIEGRFPSAAEAISDLQRRVGWLREIEKRTGGEMQHQLVDLERGIEELVALSRKTGNLRPESPGRDR
jgi:sulfide:quinone oxidoreductase